MALLNAGVLIGMHVISVGRCLRISGITRAGERPCFCTTPTRCSVHCLCSPVHRRPRALSCMARSAPNIVNRIQGVSTAPVLFSVLCSHSHACLLSMSILNMLIETLLCRILLLKSCREMCMKTAWGRSHGKVRKVIMACGRVSLIASLL